MSARASLIEDGGSAASDPDHFFRAPGVPRGRGRNPHPVDRDGGRRAAAAADRQGDRGKRSPRRDLALRLPRGERGGATPPPDPAGDRLGGDRAGQPLRPRPDRRASVARRRDGALRGSAAIRGRERHPQAPSRADPQQRAPRLAGRVAPGDRGPGRRPGARFEAAYAETMARTGAGERYLFSSEYFRAILGSGRGLAAAGKPRRGSATARSDRGRQRRLPALLPRRHRR